MNGPFESTSRIPVNRDHAIKILTHPSFQKDLSENRDDEGVRSPLTRCPLILFSFNPLLEKIKIMFSIWNVL